MKILIAEDDVTSRSMLNAMLCKLGHEVVAVCDGAKAWEVMQPPNAPRMVILDWMMPGLEGVEVCRRIRAQGGEHYTYVVLETAKGKAEDIAAGFAAGADDYLVKPLNNTQLRCRIRVAERVMQYEERLAKSNVELTRYAGEMESLAGKRARQLAHADRLATLGVLSAGIAHEINNPATFIAGNAQTMERAWEVLKNKLEAGMDPAEGESSLDFVLAEFPKMLAGVRTGVKRISKIVSGLKSYARLEKGDKKPFAIGAAIDAALQLCHNALKYNVKVEKRVDDSLPEVLGNKQQIEQVLINLFVNAANAMERQEQGVLRIEVVAEPAGIQCSVADNGPGLSAAVLEKIFSPFFTTKKQDKGTGLGLSISTGIIEEHGGALSAGNAPTGGARFVFTLPTCDVEENNVNEQHLLARKG